jgi:hypothetical protein
VDTKSDPSKVAASPVKQKDQESAFEEEVPEYEEEEGEREKGKGNNCYFSITITITSCPQY